MATIRLIFTCHREARKALCLRSAVYSTSGLHLAEVSNRFANFRVYLKQAREVNHSPVCLLVGRFRVARDSGAIP